MGDKFYTNIDGRPTLQELTAAGVSLLDSGGYYSSDNLEDLAIELYGRSNKNYCINGNFDIWQRGTSFTNPASATYTADRNQIYWVKDGGTAPTIVHSRQTLTPGELDKSYYYYRINSNGTGSGYGNGSTYQYNFQFIENGTRLLCGLNKKVTVSFYARSDIAGRVVVLEIQQTYGAGGSPTSREILTPYRITLTSSWVKYSYTFTTNTLVGKTFGTNNDDYLVFGLWLQGGSAYNSIITSPIAWTSGNIDIAQIQINPGDTALDYVAPIPSDVLRKCHRYYYTETSCYRTYVNQTSPASANFIYVNYPNLLRVNATPAITGGSMVGHHANAPSLANSCVSGFCAYWIDSNYRNTDGQGYVNFSVDAEF